MFRLLTWLFGGKSQDANNDVKALHEKIRLMEKLLLQKQDGSQETLTKDSQDDNTSEPTNCFQKTGRVTDVRADHVVIDKLYFVPKTLLKNCIASETIEENTRLSFLAYRKLDAESGESTVKVVKIISIIDEMWTAGGLSADGSDWLDKTTKPPSGATNTVYYEGNRRREPGKIIAKEDNTITVGTDAGDPIHVDMDKTRMSFVPTLGDYVTLDCIVQMDRDFVDFKGEVLEVIAVEPSRTVKANGTISIVDTRGGEIISPIGGKFVYQSQCLVDCYRPTVGDSVTFEAIENEHVQMRCLSVQQNVQAESLTKRGANPEHRRAKPIGNGTDGNGKNVDLDLWNNKQGITVTDSMDVKLKSIDDTVVHTITVKNESQSRHKILQVQPLKTIKNALVTLKSPSANAQLILFPGESVEYVFNVSGHSFYGRHREQWVWMFGGNFRIGRTFNIMIGETATPMNGSDDRVPINHKTKYLQQKLATLNMRRENTNARIVLGQKPGQKPNFVAFTIPLYNLPPSLLDLVLMTESNDELHNALNQPPYCLEEPLSARNYVRLFGYYIFLEEINQFISFRRHDIERGHFTREDTFLALHVPNIAEARPSLMVGDYMNATAPWSQEGQKDAPIYQGVIHKVLQNRVLLKFDPNFQARYNGESYQLTFSYSRGSYRKQHYALGRVKTVMGMEYLFPESIAPKPPAMDVRLNDRDELELQDSSGGESVVLPWQNSNLNHYQKVAIANVLRGEARPLPYVVFGPPGTGKTLTTIELIHQLSLRSPDCRLIVATPSNSAAYLITERLAKAGALGAGDFIRLVSSNQVEREAIPEHLAPYCATVEISESRNTANEELVTESGLRMKYQAQHIGRHRVTISTCSCIGALMQLRFPPNHFTHIIIDEAGQSLEPETLIPITLINRNVGSVTLVGDPKQLGPTVLSYAARRFGYDISLLERLLNTARPYRIDLERFPQSHGYNPRLVSKLCINYRSTPSLLALYSDFFYESQLVPERNTNADSDDSGVLTIMHEILGVKRPSADYGFFFCGIDGTNKQSPDSPSWFNPAEACMVHKIVERLYRKGIKPDDIGVITPYVMQAKTIRHIFHAATLDPPKVGSVEDFQGQERRIVLVSTVRTSRELLSHDGGSAVGFISSPKRVNVAISRSKEVLVIIGNPKLLGVDRVWMQLLHRALENETYVGCKLPPSVVSAARAGMPVETEP